MINRIIKKQLLDSIISGKSVGLIGARRTGKTVIMNSIKNDFNNNDILMVNGEDLEIAEILSSQRLETLKRFIGNYKYLFIDEAQAIKNIGLNMKLILDNIPGKVIFFTGSSALTLYHQTGEPLTGRVKFFYLYPITQSELNENFIDSKKRLEDKLVFGLYPQVVTAITSTDKADTLNSIKNGYLLKDTLTHDNQKDSIFILNLLRLIAFQIGNDISYNEMANRLNVNIRTVQRYLNILEQMYIIFSLQGFSRNLRNEYTKTPRYFFWDNGIRNIVISNLNNLNSRDDIGKLWENFCISERMKLLNYKNILFNSFFWRTYDQKEIDYIEEREGLLYAFEMKWKDQKVKHPLRFLETYKSSHFICVNNENYLDFINPEKLK